jgi:hypothetical protein
MAISCLAYPMKTTLNLLNKARYFVDYRCPIFSYADHLIGGYTGGPGSGFEARNRLGRERRDPPKVCGGPRYFHPSVEARTRAFRGQLGVESGSQDMTYDARRMLGEPSLRNQKVKPDPGHTHKKYYQKNRREDRPQRSTVQALLFDGT